MFRPITVALGIGLVVLWIAALSAHATPWLTWLDGIAGLGAIALGLAATAHLARGGMAGGFILAFSLFILWVIALASGVTLWLTWWTFAFACAFVILTGMTTPASSRLHLHRHRTV
jgi:hypothetical protein